MSRSSFGIGLAICLGLAGAVTLPAVGGQELVQFKLKNKGGGAIAVLKRCCASCDGGSCYSCNTPARNPKTKELECPALQAKATCDNDGRNCKAGW